MPGGTEGALWKLMRTRGLPGHWQRIENRVGRGVPDLNYCLDERMEGWVELKAVPRSPKNPSKPVKVSHFTKEQRFWHRERWAAGGVTSVLLRIDRPYRYFLMDGVWAAEHLGLVPESRLADGAVATWGPKWDPEVFLGGLSRLHG